MLKVFAKSEQESTHDLIYFYCVCMLFIALPTSIYFVSAAQMLMGLNWLAEGRYGEKWNRFWKNKPAVYLSAIYLVYLTGILWTQNLSYGIGFDLKNKLPILTLPFLLASIRPMRAQRIGVLPLLFSLAVLVATFVGFVIFLREQFADPRTFSPFVSHVFFSMMVVYTIFLLPWSVRSVWAEKKWYYMSLLGSLWLLVFLFILSAMTGILCLGGVAIYLFLREVFFKPGIPRKIIGVMLMAAAMAVLVYVLVTVLGPLNRMIEPEPDALEQSTLRGNLYQHDFKDPSRENGHRVNIFISEEELREAWQERSEICFDTNILEGQELRATIFRYLASRGLPKDREGLYALDEQEILAIEHGVANYLYTQWPNFLVRVHQTFWEIQQYERTGDPGGHSLTSRIELWKAAWQAFKQRPVLGWGTGDVLAAVQHGLRLNDSQLETDRLKTHPHNQYLHLLVMLGLTGTLLIALLYYLFIKYSRACGFEIFRIFLVVSLTGMLVDSPVDHQIGLTFILIFSLYFGILKKQEGITNR